MTVELPENAPDETVYRAEELHEFAIDQLGIAPRDIEITAKPHSGGFWVIEMEQFPYAGTEGY